MDFLNSSFLWGLPLIAVPVVIHLLTAGGARLCAGERCSSFLRRWPGDGVAGGWKTCCSCCCEREPSQPLSSRWPSRESGRTGSARVGSET